MATPRSWEPYRPSIKAIIDRYDRKIKTVQRQKPLVIEFSKSKLKSLISDMVVGEYMKSVKNMQSKAEQNEKKAIKKKKDQARMEVHDQILHNFFKDD